MIGIISMIVSMIMVVMISVNAVIVNYHVHHLIYHISKYSDADLTWMQITVVVLGYGEMNMRQTSEQCQQIPVSHLAGVACRDFGASDCWRDVMVCVNQYLKHDVNEHCHECGAP